MPDSMFSVFFGRRTRDSNERETQRSAMPNSLSDAPPRYDEVINQSSSHQLTEQGIQRNTTSNDYNAPPPGYYEAITQPYSDPSIAPSYSRPATPQDTSGASRLPSYTQSQLSGSRIILELAKYIDKRKREKSRGYNYLSLWGKNFKKKMDANTKINAAEKLLNLMLYRQITIEGSEIEALNDGRLSNIAHKCCKELDQSLKNILNGHLGASHAENYVIEGLRR